MKDVHYDWISMATPCFERRNDHLRIIYLQCVVNDVNNLGEQVKR
ncbi:MAG: hypothetical protein JWP81_317 [Ferruginibacter sp.]|nr:hypothetical protein [Ferruginibacter sp.]